MLARPVALLYLTTLLSACGELTIDDGTVRTANTCQFEADEPHRSTHGAHAGRNEINALGWFRCSSSPPDVTLHVKLERQVGAGWEYVPGDDDEVRRPVLQRKYSLPMPVPCADGVYRAGARLTGHDVDGAERTSRWTFSRTREISC